MGGGRLYPRRGRHQDGRARPDGHAGAGGMGRRRRRLRHLCAGGGRAGGGRCLGQHADERAYLGGVPADPQLRHRGAEAAVPEAALDRRHGRRVLPDRAGRRIGRCGDQVPRSARRRFLRAQRQQAVHLQRQALRRRAGDRGHRSRRRQEGHQRLPGAAGHQGLRGGAAGEQAGAARVGHRAAGVPGLPHSRRPAPGRGRRGAEDRARQSRRRPHRHRGAGHRHGARGARGSGQIRQGAQDLRQGDRGAPGDRLPPRPTWRPRSRRRAP